MKLKKFKNLSLVLAGTFSFFNCAHNPSHERQLYRPVLQQQTKSHLENLPYTPDKDWLRKQILNYLKNKHDEPAYVPKHINKVNADNFEEKVLQSKLPVILEFGAKWCGFCEKMKPVFDEVCGKYEGRIYCAEIDSDESHDIFEHYKIEYLPTFGFFNKGKAVKRYWFDGTMRKKILDDLVERFLEYVK